MSELDIVIARDPFEVRHFGDKEYRVVSAEYQQSNRERLRRPQNRRITDAVARVAWEGYSQQQNSRESDPRFVVSPEWTAADTFAIAAMTGVLRGAGRVKNLTGKIRELSDTLDLLAHDGVGRRLNDLPGGRSFMAWRYLLAEKSLPDSDNLPAAVKLWQRILINPGDTMRQLEKKMQRTENARLREARDHIDRAHKTDRILGGIALFVVRGNLQVNDLLHWRLDNRGATADAADWRYPLVAVMRGSKQQPGKQSLAVSVPNGYVAQELFGSSGLDVVESVSGFTWAKDTAAQATVRRIEGAFGRDEAEDFFVELARIAGRNYKGNSAEA